MRECVLCSQTLHMVSKYTMNANPTQFCVCFNASNWSHLAFCVCTFRRQLYCKCMRTRTHLTAPFVACADFRWQACVFTLSRNHRSHRAVYSAAQSRTVLLCVGNCSSRFDFRSRAAGPRDASPEPLTESKWLQTIQHGTQTFSCRVCVFVFRVRDLPETESMHSVLWLRIIRPLQCRRCWQRMHKTHHDLQVIRRLFCMIASFGNRMRAYCLFPSIRNSSTATVANPSKPQT